MTGGMYMSERAFNVKINVCDEAPVDLIVNNKKLATFMCTPAHLNELAMGYLFSRGLIQSVDDVHTLAACDDMRKVYVTIRGSVGEEQYSLAGVLASGCGNGMIFSESFLQMEPIYTTLQVKMAEVQQLAVTMCAEAALYKETGGVHCAALVNGQQLLALREDVGRHNAVDKVIGKGLFLRIGFSESMILTTGRISSDMVLKAVAGRIPLVASRSIPSSLALEIAEKSGITVIGRVFAKEPIVYTHPERVLNQT